MSLFLFAIVQSLLFSAVLSQGTCKETSDVRFTFYGMPDGGDTLAFSCGSNGGKAGGTGSYSNPETFATSRSNPGFQKCDIVYIPYFQKYFQFSDYCVQCDTDYTTTNAVHIDLWIGGNTNDGPAHAACEVQFGSIKGQTIIQNPPSNLPVNSGGLWDGTSCHDASSANPFVYLNPSTAGLCSGSNSSPSGGAPMSSPPVPSSTPVPSSAPTPSSTPVPSSAPVPSSTPMPSSTPVPLSIPAVQSSTPPVVLPSVVPISSPVKSVIPPTTLMTLVSTSSASTSKATSATTSSPSTVSSNTADCASWHGCIGDPCETFNDCAGDWICMGTPKTCHDNRLD